jgi:hypothetical protein
MNCVIWKINKYKKLIHLKMRQSTQLLNNSHLVQPKSLEQLALIKLIEVNHKCLTEIPYCNILKKYDWNDISKNIKLTEAFIERFKDNVNWKLISLYQELSESFIERFKDYVDWLSIRYYQDISLKFKYKYDLNNLEVRCDVEDLYFMSRWFYNKPIDLTFLGKHKIIRSIYGESFHNVHITF